MNTTLALSGAARLRKRALMFLVLFFVTFMVHAFVLRFIFPGYYKPLSIQHEDHYIPASFAYALHPGYLDLMHWTRPVFMVFLKIIGHAGTAGSIAYVIGLVFLDCILSALLIKRILGLSFNGTFLFYYIVYCYLLFTSSYFYILYTQDVGSHLSYFFLILGAFSFSYTLRKSPVLCGGLLFLCCTLAFLSKETYQLVALFFAFLWFLYYRRVSLKRALIPMGATLAAFIISVANNMRLNSVFVNTKAAKGAPYEINLSPFSVLHEWARYAKAGVNIADLLIIFLIGYMVLKFKRPARKQLLFIITACSLAALLSWLPNAVLPNHHYSGYSFNGLFLFYLPLFFLPYFHKEQMLTIFMSAVIVILCLTSYWLNRSKYRNAENNWVREQEVVERNLLHSLDSLINRLTPSPQPHKILVEGITFPFHPFSYPQSLREYPNAPLALYDVVYYTPNARYQGRNDLVKFITPSDTLFTHYDQKWVFEEDGRLKGYDERHGGADGEEFSINLQNLSDFKTEGIYPPEKDIAWTNGKASIDLPAGLGGKDSLTVILATYMPAVCKNIFPRLSLTDTANSEYQSTQTDRKKDLFYYHFKVNKKASIKKVNISSRTIDSGPDKRVLSFPFRGLTIK